MLPFVMMGMTEASTTRTPSTPWTRMVNGSTTAIGSVAGPSLHVQDGCSAVSASSRTQSRMSLSVAPARATLFHARRAPQGEIKRYPDGHFDIYVGQAFERVVKDQIEFLRRRVPV